MDAMAVVREQLVTGLRGDDAHMTFEDAVEAFPDAAINERAPNVAYTPWHLVEHLRRAQRDMLDYIRDPGYVAPEWPRGYWPDPVAVTTPDGFRASVDAFLADRRALEAIALDPAVDVLAGLAHAPEHTVARCLRVIANHNSYHVGELGSLRQVTESWARAPDRRGSLSHLPRRW